MSIEKLKSYVKSDNVASELSDEKLLKIGQKVISGFDEDFASSAEWMADVKRVLDLSNLKSTKKNYPLPTSANVKFPIITKAAYEFASRTSPEIIKDGKVVKAHVLGPDDEQGSKQKQATRVTDYMNYQLLFQNTTWELELDRLLNTLALIGFLCKKTYYDPKKKKITSCLCEYDDLIINSDVSNLDDAQRITHILHLSLNDLISSARAGVYLNDPVDELVDVYGSLDVRPTIDAIEQHCFLDLDDDDYEEPYIATVLKDSGKVLRIIPRFIESDIESRNNKVVYINPIQYFTDYHFLVSPTGKFQSVGFGILMLHLNESINTLLNQLIDAGQLANLQGGYVDSSFKMENSEQTLHDPGEFKKVVVAGGKQLKEGFVPIDYKEPSSVLFQLLGLLIASAKELSSSTEVTSGSSSTENAKSGAVMALIQQALVVFNAIQRRVYRSLASEYQKIFQLNGMYSDPSMFVQILNQNLVVQKGDFDKNAVHIIPIADPNLSSDIMRSAQLQFLASLSGRPGLNEMEITRRMVNSTNIANPEQLLLSKEETQAKPDPEAIKVQAEIQAEGERLEIEGRKQDLEERKFMLDVLKTESVIILNRANAMKSIAQADESQSKTDNHEFENQLAVIQTHLDSLLNMNRFSLDVFKNQQAGLNNAVPTDPGMVVPPGNEDIGALPPV